MIPELETPGRLIVRIPCPRCHIVSSVEAEVTGVLVETTDIEGDTAAEIKTKYRAQVLPHACNQTTLDLETGEVGE